MTKGLHVSKEKLLKINEEYKILTSLDFGYYFKFNKVKSISLFFLGLFFLLFFMIFFKMINVFYTPDWSLSFTPLFIKTIFSLVSFSVLLTFVSLIYVQVYSLVEFLRKRKLINQSSNFETYNHYKQYIKAIKSEANLILKELKNER